MERQVTRTVLIAVFVLVCAAQFSESEKEERDRRDISAVASSNSDLLNLSDKRDGIPLIEKEHTIVKRGTGRRCRRRRIRNRRSNRRRRRNRRSNRRRSRKMRVGPPPQIPKPPPPPAPPQPKPESQGCVSPCGLHAHCDHGSCICDFHCEGDPYSECHYMKK